MSLPTLFIELKDELLRSQINSLDELSSFEIIQSTMDVHWIDKLQQLQPDTAIVEVSRFTTDDFKSLSSATGLDKMDLIIISTGTPNKNLDMMMNHGAIFHYRKPVDMQILEDTLADFSQYFLQKQEEGRKVSTSDLDQFGMLVGSSKPMHKLYRTLRRVAKTDTNVLIVGESGAGKELVAQTIHLASDRKNQPFIAINCGAISPELVDSELFGHEKGAFTGANRTHQGVFRQAEGGTLFLDEITEMPLEHQVKLLRVLETGEYRPVGSNATSIANTRVIAATNRDPQVAIEEQFLREDLYFRLAHFPIHVPPLRERGDDIVGLAKHFIAHRNANETTAKTIFTSALQKISAHAWPGNVRELKHCIERAFILADETIKDEHLIFDTPPLETGTTVEDMVPAGVSLEKIEKAAIINTLEENEGNKKETAQDLGISIKTLYNKLDKYQE
ncbi:MULTISPECIES: sigma-54 interaction domain-containing protein [Vibrio]|jgi:DNA-binding NtrC family response regulator|uniref:sigma-54 interaction domain-containing protein n=1 Tax=Vibrio TaxID=662 RepID=UPI0002EBD3AD|nr:MULTISPECIES: sigma-54 dependent transcriptional regulator [Vibrio]OEE91944.1 sigma-54-dependent Fis family transcriptional regulator [Vibrio crassostreae 9ZC77]PMH17778.1 sigma-54-dependent Fis family transcriptional regulator [Vibrio splendidus]PMI25845.1 sigma-54-dependent Fis family transcriptional regulator [Vibrio splendidus]PMM37953.1 sigma-54-dependent Fis family transcriptional regulator [Vibrio splendidus]PMN75048.1 sigma-54-dependent Fis family transcriptional regulator [Vibrio s